VVDIGANIGVFSLYAASQGAKKVLAYEPAGESFDLLRENIKINNLGDIISPNKVAVVGKPIAEVWFPRHSSVFNAISTSNEDASNHEKVPAITFTEIIGNIPSQNIVKMDCEGGEYDIVLNSDLSVFKRIDEVRLEYHRGLHHQLFERFEEAGFLRRQFMNEGEGGGYLWLTKTPI